MNARLNHRRKAAGFILRMFQLHAEDRARLTPCSGMSGLNPYKRAKDTDPVFDTEPRVSRILAKRAMRSHPKKLISPAAPHSVSAVLNPPAH